MQASFVQKQQIGIKMNPQLYQSLKLMELPLIDLREKIEEELEINPALEVLRDLSTVSLNDAEPRRREVEEYFESTSDSGFLRKPDSKMSDNHQSFMEGVLSRPETLQQHLLWQLQLEPIDEEIRSIASVLIQNLDDNGFHIEPPSSLFKKNDKTSVKMVFIKVTPTKLAKAMKIVRALEPVGCCTENYLESLKVQISMIPDAPVYMESSLEHLELLKKGKFSEAAKKIHCSEEEARNCLVFIKKLSPFPGNSFTAAEVRFVIPDIQVVRNESDFSIIFNNDVIPVLGISPFFKKLDPGIRKGNSRMNDGLIAREFARDNIRKAKVFINSLSMRNQTLKLVAHAIVEFQRPFFVNGPQHLVPLTLGDIASELGIHETTVSRTANGKYMQTEWGIFEFRHFFTNSISGTGSGGSRFSKEGVKAILQELLSSADNQGLSDSEISGLLARRGISLARRTVAKYRNELDLGSSYTR